jgi:hypothetical protein
MIWKSPKFDKFVFVNVLRKFSNFLENTAL